MSDRRFWLGLALIALAAFGVRLAVAAKFQGLSTPPKAAANPDQVDYEEFGWQLASGQGYTRADGTPTACRPPGTSAALVPAYALFGHDYAAARVEFSLLSALACVASGLLAAAVFGRAAGLIAALVLCCLPNHFYYAQHFLSEVPYSLLIALALGAAVRSYQRGGRTLLDLGAGLLLAAAMLTRPQASLCLPIAAGLVLFIPRPTRRRAALQLARTALGCALLVAPWMLRNHAVIGTANLSTLSGHVFWGAHNATVLNEPGLIGSWIPIDSLIDAQHPMPAGEAARAAAAWRYGLDFAREHGAELPRLVFWKLVRQYSPFSETSNRGVYWSFALAWIALAPLCLLGIARGWRRARAATLLVLVPMLSTLLIGIVFYGAVRFRDGDASLYVVPAAGVLAALLPRRWRDADQGSSVPPSSR